MSEAIPTSERTARITEWKADKGYGWLQMGQQRVFLHRRDYTGSNRVPEVGEEVRFIPGQDAQGRPCAKHAVSTRRPGPGLLSLVALAALLVLPAMALQRVPLETWMLASWVVAISLITYAAYASDKRRARMNSWRIPEAHLNLLELGGGWPGAWLAQQRLRHKCSKRSYQFRFWLIILTHQFLAFDSLQNWSYSKRISQQATELKPHRR